MLTSMGRLVTAVLGMCFVLAMAGAMVASARWLAAAALCVGAVAYLAGFLTNPRATVLALTTLVGIGLIVGGRSMEGAGILILLLAAALTRTREQPTTAE